MQQLYELTWTIGPIYPRFAFSDETMKGLLARDASVEALDNPGVEDETREKHQAATLR